ncbi:MAG: histidine--tRNA ligase [Ruminococcaceae bacterium]|nr:histidine--tRNA ligase [Oscillospiraceae bacterium]
MALITQGPKGTQDLMPKDTAKWQIAEEVMRGEAALHGFHEVRTPVFEHTELFLRGVGDTTDVVEKQMYTFEDKGQRSITLRPEGTAGVVRAMLQSGIYNEGYPVKLCYFTSCYRYEKPQAGRLREFHQFGIEMFGAAEPVADADVILVAKGIFDRLGVKNLRLELNSIGCPKCRANYHKALKEYFEQYKGELCDTCLSRLERNPMRILDCKSEICSKIAEGAPKIVDYLCEECQEHFTGVQEALDAAGVEYVLNPTIVRGLDYYTRTVFEFVSCDLGSQSTVCGGGRYDGLVEEMGGKPTAGLGFGLGMERLMLILEAQGIELPGYEKCEIYIASMGKEALKKAVALATELRNCGVYAEYDLCGRGLKAQMKYADKIGAAYTVVLGDNEIAENKAQLKNMKSGEKKDIRIDENFIDDYLSNTVDAEILNF